MNLYRLWARPRSWTATAVGVALVASGVGAASRWATRSEPREAPPQVLALRSSEVARVIVASTDHRVELTRAPDGSWSGAADAPPEAARLMADATARLLPLGAYRALGVDTSAAAYGLVDPEITFSVEDIRGRHHEVLFGARTFTGGFYARRGGEPGRVYLVPRRMIDDLRSLLAGRSVETPTTWPSPPVTSPDRQTDGGTTMSGFLRQVLDAGYPLPKELR